MTSDMENLRYPVGRFRLEGEVTPERRSEWVAEIEGAPAALRRVVADLSEAQLDTPYRPGGWTVRQVVHHLADSHMNSFVRFKLALTEEEPTIKPYFEDRFAELVDARDEPIAPSLDLLTGLHARWVRLLRSLGAGDFERGFFHPEHGRRSTLGWNLALYAWHGRHHTAHIGALREREGWTMAG